MPVITNGDGALNQKPRVSVELKVLPKAGIGICAEAAAATVTAARNKAVRMDGGTEKGRRRAPEEGVWKCGGLPDGSAGVSLARRPSIVKLRTSRRLRSGIDRATAQRKQVRVRRARETVHGSGR